MCDMIVEMEAQKVKDAAPAVLDVPSKAVLDALDATAAAWTRGEAPPAVLQLTPPGIIGYNANGSPVAAHPAVAATGRLWEKMARMADPATRAEREARERAADEARVEAAREEEMPLYLCRIRSGRREYHAAGGWLVAPDNAETRATWELGRGEFTVPVGEAECPDVESAAVLRADEAALAALRDWETAVAEEGRRYPATPGAESLERRCRARVERALAAADREARS